MSVCTEFSHSRLSALEDNTVTLLPAEGGPLSWGWGGGDGYVTSCFQEERGQGSPHPSCMCCSGGLFVLVLLLFFQVSVTQDNNLVSFTSKSFTWGLASDRRRDTFF